MTTTDTQTVMPPATPETDGEAAVRVERLVSRPVELVLSLFPGIGLLDSAFEAEGFQVVRGPDILWGGDVHRFHVPAGVFTGVIGGPPCQTFSTASAIRGTAKLDLIPEFLRVVREAQPEWVVMENVQ
jgi:DNA (cytosine-5)-methyltransferase 1